MPRTRGEDRDDAENQCCDEWSPAVEVIDSQTGDRICTRCGRVLDSLAFATTYADMDRCNAPADCRAFGTEISSNVPPQTAQRAVKLLGEMVGRLHVSDGTSRCARELLDDSLALERGKISSLPLRAAACLYYGTKMDGCDRSEMEISSSLSLKLRDFRRATKRLRELLASRPYATRMLRGVSPAALLPRVIQTMSSAIRGPVRPSLSNARLISHASRRLASAIDDPRCAAEVSAMKPMCIAMAVSWEMIEQHTVQPVDVDVDAVSKACGASILSVKHARDILARLGT